MTDSIRLGLMPPLTGLVEIYGTEIVCAARIACDEINEAGGVLGRPLELIVEVRTISPDSPALKRADAMLRTAFPLEAALPADLTELVNQLGDI